MRSRYCLDASGEHRRLCAGGRAAAFTEARTSSALRVGDDGDFIVGEALDGLQDESLAGRMRSVPRRAISTRRSISSEEAICSRRLDPAIGDDGRAQNRFVGLMELQFGFVAGAHIALARPSLPDARCPLLLIGAGAHLVDGTHSKPVEPGLESKALRLFAAVAEGAGDGFIDHFFGRDGVASRSVPRVSRKYSSRSTKRSRRREVYVDVGADVVTGNHGCLHRRNGLFKRNLAFRAVFRAAPPAGTFVQSSAEQVLVPGNLLQQVIECGL